MRINDLISETNANEDFSSGVGSVARGLSSVAGGVHGAWDAAKQGYQAGRAAVGGVSSNNQNAQKAATLRAQADALDGGSTATYNQTAAPKRFGRASQSTGGVSQPYVAPATAPAPQATSTAPTGTQSNPTGTTTDADQQAKDALDQTPGSGTTVPVGSKDAAEIRQQKQTANSIAAQANMAQNATAAATPTPTTPAPAGTSFAPKPGFTVPGAVTPSAVNNTVAAKPTAAQPADAGKPGFLQSKLQGRQPTVEFRSRFLGMML